MFKKGFKLYAYLLDGKNIIFFMTVYIFFKCNLLFISLGHKVYALKYDEKMKTIF